CQQYYSRHDYAHLVRGEINSFLTDYYHSLTIADPELYSFWEHFSMNEQGPYKTHEQAWFLMQTRWMLYLEQGDTLRLLAGVPRAWLADGQTIAFSGMKSYFGAVTVRVQSDVAQGRITARVSCPGPHRPRQVTIRLPPPERRRGCTATGGRYDPDRETVVIDAFTGEAEVRLGFCSGVRPNDPERAPGDRRPSTGG
ncbi:hypothetical protein HQ590_04335, partial [bacterium]|nr:hypothetical protein [bacterium]